MTREEAKRRVECCRDFLAANYADMGEPNFTALNMAIEALSEPTTIKKAKEEVLMELLNYTYGMLTTEKFGLQGKIASMLHDIGADSEPTKTEPTRPKAKWIRRNCAVYHCSNCHYTVHQKYDFCVCGAEMESE